MRNSYEQILDLRNVVAPLAGARFLFSSKLPVKKKNGILAVTKIDNQQI